MLTHLTAIEQQTEDLSNAAQHNDFISCGRLVRNGAGLNDVDSAGTFNVGLLFYCVCKFD